MVLALEAAQLPMAAFAAGDFEIEGGVLKKYTGSGGNVTIPEGVTSIGESAFSRNYKLTAATIPESVISIGENVFRNCYEVTVYGAAGSTAETYADANNIPFVVGQGPAAGLATTGIAYPSTQMVDVNGTAVEFQCYALKDDKGGAYTYYKLRDLGVSLDFLVDWSAERGIFIETK